MTVTDIDKIIKQGEGVSVEFKEAQGKVPTSFYETVVSFANTNGGTILLGVDDEGNIVGINPENKIKFLKNITTALNSKDNINPVLYLNPLAIEVAGKTVIAVQIPASSQTRPCRENLYSYL
jgi:ATP-dependent DNA helicase RecG